jgi:alpha/beta superfamily hydrolase
MSEQQIKIPIPETDLEIHGVLRGGSPKPLIILAPGLGGWMHDLLVFNASRFFEKHGIASLRVSFYGWDKHQRDIKDVYVKTFAQDIDTIVDYAKQQGNRRVAVIGHSYSGLGIVYSAKQQFDAAVLWDPTHTDGYEGAQAKKNLENDFIYIKEFNAYVAGKGSGDVISRKVFEEYAPGSTAKAKDFKIETLVINASYSKEMKEYGKNYAESIDAPTKHIIIPNSTHPFVEDGAMEKLFEETLKWLKPQIK